MVTNLRALSVNTIDNTLIQISFTDSLVQNIDLENVSIISQTPNVASPQVLKLRIIDNILELTTQPLTELASYYIVFSSTNSIKFKSLNGNAILFEDGIANKIFFLGPINQNNIIKDYLLNYLRENVYNTESYTFLAKYIDYLSVFLSRAIYDIRQARNENYLSITINDERKTRGKTAFDRLDEEGAYEILRVGKTASNAISLFTLSIDEFTNNPISLLQSSYSESLIVNSIDQSGFFNINNFNLNLSKRFVIKLQSVIFTYSNGHLPYEYDISKYGYQILDQKYDTDVAFKYLQLGDNQIRLSDKILEDPEFSLDAIFQIQVSYDYKDTGRSIDPASVSVETVSNSGREVLPPLKNVFNLKHGPIVSSSNNIGTIGDIQFIDQNAFSYLNADHPAFTTEIKFRLDLLPSKSGEFSIDYETGTVYVFGSNGNDGTGDVPPLAVYKYRTVFKENIDWVLDSDTDDFVALPSGSLIDNSADIEFNYEQVLSKDIDYKEHIHKEILDERIGNNLLALNVLSVEQGPITNVFRIFNETSGEIYKISRWNNNKIYYFYNKPPTLKSFTSERVTFEDISNEILFVNEVLDSGSTTTKIFKIILNNNNIMSQSQDCIGASFNTSVYFSNNNIFSKELYFDSWQSQDDNLVRLNNIGQYFIDYTNGVVYILVSAGQDFNLGSVSYKRGYIDPQYSHVTSVEDIYYRINTLSLKEKHFEYISFDDGFILPKTFDSADEQTLTADLSSVYVVNDNLIGSFISSEFINSVRDSIKFIRNIYEINDLLYNSTPINFTEAASFNDKSISISNIEHQEYHSVEYGVDGYFVTLNTDLNYLSSNIQLDIEVIRLNDSQNLWNGSGTIVLGSPLTLVLPGINSTQVGDSVSVIYAFSINDLSHVAVDYNKGDYYIDYTALTDEIIVSYEYGDNSLDFRESNALNAGDTYFVSYKVGALRDALLKNFGSLINIDLLNTLDVSFSRERYRDSLIAAMSSFSKGPTVEAIKNIAKTISHLPAEVKESIFTNWSLGNSLLNPDTFKTSGNFQLVPVKYGNGLLINDKEQSVNLQAVSNIRLSEGTFEAWVRPEWDGLDNIADIKIIPFKDGYLASELEVFIGALEYHPDYETDIITGEQFFTLNKTKRVEGIPNKNKDGIYFYYDNDITNNFKRWFVEVIDGYANDGYSVDGYANKKYSISISTNGKFYDVKSLSYPQPSSSKITSGTNNLNFTVNSVFPNEGITFLADNQHYVIDYAEEENRNRLSIFKDESGYFNLKIYDKFKNIYIVSTDVSDWKHGELHHIAASWKINSVMGRDEIHLFVDGFEVPNIIKYNDRIKPYLHEKFRTVNPEEIVGIIDNNIVSANDLSTIIGSTQVISSINFSQYGINVGDTIYIEESGFDDNGYSIINVNGNTLTLSTTMPSTISDGKFSVNKISFDVKSEIDIFPNFNVSLIHSFLKASDLNTTVDSNILTSSTTNFVDGYVVVGDLLRINDDDFQKHYTIIDVDTNTLIVNDLMPATLTNVSFNIYHNEEEEIPGLRALHPSYELSKSNDGYFTNILTLRNDGLVDDLVLIRTLGINHRKVKRRYYVWSDNTNILKTKLPTPLALDEVKFNKVLLANTFIGPDNATLTSGIFYSDNITTDQPTDNAGGRTLSVSIFGDNIDFTTPVNVDITGFIVNYFGQNIFTTETLSFSEAGIQDTTNLFSKVSYINVSCKPTNSSKNCAVVEIKEKYSLTIQENLGIFITSSNTIPQPVVRYSYQISVGNTLFTDGYTVGDGYIVTDDNNFFSSSVVGNYLIITNPLEAAGFYKIQDVSSDHHTLTLTSDFGNLPLSSFTDGYYEILNTTDVRNGLQNGYFTFEHKYLPGEPYFLTQGLYELDYYTYLQVPFDLTPNYIHIGSDFENRNHLHGSISDIQILNVKLTDTRIGETIASTQRSITKDFNSVKSPKIDKTTLVASHLDTVPPTNIADTYITADKNIIQAGEVINDNFTQSICLTSNPISIDNNGILNTKKEGTIEFWINPIFDAVNDPNYRFYFDAFGAVSETVVSTNSTTVQISGSASEILGIRLVPDYQNINYFAGGSIKSDNKTLLLHKELPNQNTNVIVDYIPKGLNGDRISIYKDPYGYVNFRIIANGINNYINTPVFWNRNTWHRIKATYKINNGSLLDEMHLYVDGYEKNDILSGTDILFGQNLVLGSSYSGGSSVKYSIKFSDPINKFNIGSDYNGGNTAYCLIDNFRISNVARPLYQPFGEPLDPNYSSNLDMVYPITEDLNTTLLINFDTLISKNEDFALLNGSDSGLSDFSVNILDSFGIISNNSRVKDVLEDLIKNFKPANSKAFISYK